MFKIPRQEYTAELNEPAVKRVCRVWWIAAVVRVLGLIEQTLRNRVSTAKAGKLNPQGAKSITSEEMERSRARAENSRLRMESEILRKAAAHFANDVL